MFNIYATGISMIMKGNKKTQKEQKESLRKELFSQPSKKENDTMENDPNRNRTFLQPVLDHGTGKQIQKELKKYGIPPLLIVSSTGHVDATRKLLETGIDVNMQNPKDGNTALHTAVLGCHLGVVKLLLAAKADPSITNHDGNNVFMASIHKPHNSAIVSMLFNLRSKFDINQTNKVGYAAIHLAAEERWESLLHNLLSFGASKNVGNKDGNTPLILAASIGDKKSVEKLMAFGANILVENYNECTAICVAVKHEEKAIAKYLLSKLSDTDRVEFVERRINLMETLPDGKDIDSFYTEYLYPVFCTLANDRQCKQLLFRYMLVPRWLDKIYEHLDNDKVSEQAMACVINCMFLLGTDSSVIDNRFVDQFIKYDGPGIMLNCLEYYKTYNMDAMIAVCVMPLLPLADVPAGEKWLQENGYRIQDSLSVFSMMVASMDQTDVIEEKISGLWDRFNARFRKIQAAQAEIRGTELVECEEREKTKREKKRQKKRKKRQQQRVKKCEDETAASPIKPGDEEGVLAEHVSNSNELQIQQPEYPCLLRQMTSESNPESHINHDDEMSGRSKSKCNHSDNSKIDNTRSESVSNTMSPESTADTSQICSSNESTIVGTTENKDNSKKSKKKRGTKAERIAAELQRDNFQPVLPKKKAKELRRQLAINEYKKSEHEFEQSQKEKTPEAKKKAINTASNYKNTSMEDRIDWIRKDRTPDAKRNVLAGGEYNRTSTNDGNVWFQKDQTPEAKKDQTSQETDIEDRNDWFQKDQTPQKTAIEDRNDWFQRDQTPQKTDIEDRNDWFQRDQTPQKTDIEDRKDWFQRDQSPQKTDIEDRNDWFQEDHTSEVQEKVSSGAEWKQAVMEDRDVCVQKEQTPEAETKKSSYDIYKAKNETSVSVEKIDESHKMETFENISTKAHDEEDRENNVKTLRENTKNDFPGEHGYNSKSFLDAAKYNASELLVKTDENQSNSVRVILESPQCDLNEPPKSGFPKVVQCWQLEKYEKMPCAERNICNITEKASMATPVEKNPGMTFLEFMECFQRGNQIAHLPKENAPIDDVVASTSNDIFAKLVNTCKTELEPNTQTMLTNAQLENQSTNDTPPLLAKEVTTANIDKILQKGDRNITVNDIEKYNVSVSTNYEDNVASLNEDTQNIGEVYQTGESSVCDTSQNDNPDNDSCISQDDLSANSPSLSDVSENCQDQDESSKKETTLCPKEGGTSPILKEAQEKQEAFAATSARKKLDFKSPKKKKKNRKGPTMTFQQLHKYFEETAKKANESQNDLSRDNSNITENNVSPKRKMSANILNVTTEPAGDTCIDNDQQWPSSGEGIKATQQKRNLINIANHMPSLIAKMNTVQTQQSLKENNSLNDGYLSDIADMETVVESTRVMQRTNQLNMSKDCVAQTKERNYNDVDGNQQQKTEQKESKHEGMETEQMEIQKSPDKQTENVTKCLLDKSEPKFVQEDNILIEHTQENNCRSIWDTGNQLVEAASQAGHCEEKTDKISCPPTQPELKQNVENVDVNDRLNSERDQEHQQIQEQAYQKLKQYMAEQLEEASKAQERLAFQQMMELKTLLRNEQQWLSEQQALKLSESRPCADKENLPQTDTNEVCQQQSDSSFKQLLALNHEENEEVVSDEAQDHRVVAQGHTSKLEPMMQYGISSETSPNGKSIIDETEANIEQQEQEVILDSSNKRSKGEIQEVLQEISPQGFQDDNSRLLNETARPTRQPDLIDTSAIAPQDGQPVHGEMGSGDYYHTGNDEIISPESINQKETSFCSAPELEEKKVICEGESTEHIPSDLTKCKPPIDGVIGNKEIVVSDIKLDMTTSDKAIPKEENIEDSPKTNSKRRNIRTWKRTLSVVSRLVDLDKYVEPPDMSIEFDQFTHDPDPIYDEADDDYCMWIRNQWLGKGILAPTDKFSEILDAQRHLVNWPDKEVYGYDKMPIDKGNAIAKLLQTTNTTSVTDANENEVEKTMCHFWLPSHLYGDADDEDQNTKSENKREATAKISIRNLNGHVDLEKLHTPETAKENLPDIVPGVIPSVSAPVLHESVIPKSKLDLPVAAASRTSKHLMNQNICNPSETSKTTNQSAVPLSGSVSDHSTYPKPVSKRIVSNLRNSAKPFVPTQPIPPISHPSDTRSDMEKYVRAPPFKSLRTQPNVPLQTVPINTSGSSQPFIPDGQERSELAAFYDGSTLPVTTDQHPTNPNAGFRQTADTVSIGESNNHTEINMQLPRNIGRLSPVKPIDNNNMVKSSLTVGNMFGVMMKLDLIADAQRTPNGMFRLGRLAVPVEQDTFFLSSSPRGGSVLMGLYDETIPVAIKKMSHQEFEKIKASLPPVKPPDFKLKHILPYMYFCNDESYGYVATDLCRCNLEQFLLGVHRGSLHRAVVQSITRQLIVGLEHLHSIGIAHRRLKPQNVLIAMNGGVRLSDYGMNEDCDVDTDEGTNIGNSSRCWRSTESVNNSDCSLTSTDSLLYKRDIQVAGMLIYYILTVGEHPYGAEPTDIEMNISQGFAKLRILPEGVDALIQSMLVANPLERPTAAEILRHPFFWNDSEKFQFLAAIPKCLGRLDYEGNADQTIEGFVELSFEFSKCNWRNEVDTTVVNQVEDLLKYTFPPTLYGLLQLIESVQIYWDTTLSTELKALIEDPACYFLSRFHTLVAKLYSIFKGHVTIGNRTY